MSRSKVPRWSFHEHQKMQVCNHKCHQKKKSSKRAPSRYLRMTLTCSSAMSYVSSPMTVHSIDLTSRISARLDKSGSGPSTDDGRSSGTLLIVCSAVMTAICETFRTCSRACCSVVRPSIGSAESTKEFRKSAPAIRCTWHDARADP
jgi:hypothetical protein